MDKLADGWMNFHQAVSPSLAVLPYLKFMDSEVKLPLLSCVNLETLVFSSGKCKEDPFYLLGLLGGPYGKYPPQCLGHSSSPFCRLEFLKIPSSCKALYSPTWAESSLCPHKETQFYEEAVTSPNRTADEQQGRDYVRVPFHSPQKLSETVLLLPILYPGGPQHG